VARELRRRVELGLRRHDLQKARVDAHVPRELAQLEGPGLCREHISSHDVDVGPLVALDAPPTTTVVKPTLRSSVERR
jgi:hypothetical protein